MKLLSYREQNQPPHGLGRVGLVVSETEFVTVEDALSAAGHAAPSGVTDIHAWIEAGPRHWRTLALAAARAAGDGSLPRRRLDSISFLPAVQRPSKICCLALNNSANAERIMSGSKHPALFTKPASALVGHQGGIRLKPHYGRVHPEPELAVIIGKTATDVKAEHAYDYVFGYTVHNDLTSPTMRTEDTFHYRAVYPAEAGQEGVRYVDTHVSYPGRYKGTDTFAALGPWIVTKDEIPDPHALNIQCHVDGELYTSDNTVNLFHKTPEVIAFISSYMTLEPGDVISLGTALAVGAKPGRAVQNADLNRMRGPVSVTIERVGTIENPLVHVVV